MPSPFSRRFRPVSFPVGRFLLTAVSCLAWSWPQPAAAEEPFDPARLEKEILVNACSDPMQLEVAPSGRVYFIQRAGALRSYDPPSATLRTLGRIPTEVYGEVGLLGLALDRSFEVNRQLYVVYCPASARDTLRLSRFTLVGPAGAEGLDLGTERKVLEYRIDTAGAVHMGGGLARTPEGNLLWGTGDNCPPIPEVPLDTRPGQSLRDALRSAGNSQDLRGKVLRIRPEPDGTYSLPAENLFPGGRYGRPEIYAMGCRNPFRVFQDPVTGWVYWGDVGPNVDPAVGMGPLGYDEVNQAREPGNFGWPLFTGGNEPFLKLDFATRKVGPPFDVERPINDSPNNTGLRLLPPPRPALLAYTSTPSAQFPEIGSGGRSVTLGPVYHFDPALASAVKLPSTFDNNLFVADWIRNWLFGFPLDPAGKISGVKPLIPGAVYRKPTDLKLGPEGALYVIELGDKWIDNVDSQIVRIVYRRGNRPPRAAVRGSPLAGKQPLGVQLDAGASRDPDGDDLKVEWDFGDGGSARGGKELLAVSHTFEHPGIYKAQVMLTDPHGASAGASVEVRVGNSVPRLEIKYPPNGSFFDWDRPVRYEVSAADEEDGDTGAGTIPSDRVVVRAAYRERLKQTELDPLGRPVAADERLLEPGLALMRKGTCFSCHTSGEKAAGPPYGAVAAANRDKPDARERLARKILSGGGGVWGAQPMPPHPQHSIEEARLMADWVLSLGSREAPAPLAGTTGAFRTVTKPDHRGDSGAYVLTAIYTDRGTLHAPPLTGEVVHVLHPRRVRAAFFDGRKGVEILDDLETEHAMVARFAGDQWVQFESMNLAGVKKVVCRVQARSRSAEGFELRADAPNGPFVARIEVPWIEDRPGWREVEAAVTNPGGIRSYFLVARAEASAGPALGFNWIEFQGAPELEGPPAGTAAPAPETPRRKPRGFVKDWSAADLAAAITSPTQTGAAGSEARSPARGRELFELMTCTSCHGTPGLPGRLGPDLSDVARQVAEGKLSRLDLLQDILEPSRRINDKFRSRTVVTRGGEVLTGLVVADDASALRLAWNAAEPSQVREIPRSEIADSQATSTSLMPAGLLATCREDEILDLLAYVETLGKPLDPSDSALRARAESMVIQHGYSLEEVALALERDRETTSKLLAALQLVPGKGKAAFRGPEGEVLVLEYPGGRHPRIGFLDGAVSPWRETKLSVFLPWEEGGYAVVDLPEALWSNLGLTFLAHQHIPTVWDLANVSIARQAWRQGPGRLFSNSYTLPNGLEISAFALPRRDVVDLELRLKNGGDAALSGLRTQICLLLKGARGFEAQTNDNKTIEGRVIAARSADGKRWIATTWQLARPWANPPCPCIHSDPTFPDLPPGEGARLRGRIFFFEGEDIRTEIRRRETEGTLDAAPEGFPAEKS